MFVKFAVINWSDSALFESTLSKSFLMWFESILFKITEFQRPTFSTSELFSRQAYLKMLSSSGFLLSLISTPYHDALMSEKYNIPMMMLKKLNLPCQVTCGLMFPMVLGGFTPMPPFRFRPDMTLRISVQLLILLRGVSWSLCPRLSMEALVWLEWMSISSERYLHIAIYLDPIVITDNDIWSVPERLVFSDWSVVYFWALYFSK